VAVAPTFHGHRYVYVAGWWAGDVYIEGHWRLVSRSGWVWVDGHYTDDVYYVRGSWHPVDVTHEGYVWVSGFFDGETWVEGFWRPEYRDGYRWVEGWFDGDGIFHCGHWEPIEERVGEVWIPGWFDGNEWQAGYWVTEAEYTDTDTESWTPEPGYDSGWEESEADLEIDDEEDLPLALPVE